MSKPVKGDDGIDLKVIEALKVTEVTLSMMSPEDAIKILSKVVSDPALTRNLSKPVVLEMAKVAVLMKDSPDENTRRIGSLMSEIARKYNEIREKQSAGGRKGNELRARSGNTARKASVNDLL